MGYVAVAVFAAALGSLICYLVMRERVRFFEQAARDLPQAFRSTSAQALAESTKQFLELAEQRFGRLREGAAADLSERQSAIANIVQPLKDALLRIDEQVRLAEKDRTGAYASLTTQINGMLAAQDGLRREAGKLASALASPTARGRWGEVQLRRVVELAGMLEYCDFLEQTRIQGAESNLRPDLIIQLPNERCIVVDAKAPMRAYMEACELEDHVARAAKLREHADQIRKHLKQLGSKSYAAQLTMSPEFVVAFLPGEIFFSAALQGDPELLEYGVQNNVILATPSTLIALLKAVAYGWRQEQVTRNAQEIQKLGAQLYDRVRVFSEHYERVGKSLESAVSAYEKGRQSMESRLLATARRFEDFGVARGGAGALPTPLPFLEHLTFGVDDESGSDPGGSGERPAAGRAQPTGTA